MVASVWAGVTHHDYDHIIPPPPHWLSTYLQERLAVEALVDLEVRGGTVIAFFGGQHVTQVGGERVHWLLLESCVGSVVWVAGWDG